MAISHVRLSMSLALGHAEQGYASPRMAFFMCFEFPQVSDDSGAEVMLMPAQETTAMQCGRSTASCQVGKQKPSPCC